MKAKFKKTPGADWMSQRKNIKGYPFITISNDARRTRADHGGSWYANATKAYPENSLKHAVDNSPGKPIFVFSHLLNTGTVCGSNQGSSERLRISYLLLLYYLKTGLAGKYYS